MTKKNNPLSPRALAAHAVAATQGMFRVGAGGVQAAIVEVEDTTTVFDDCGPARLRPRPVPGMKGLEYVPWGADNQLPYRLAALLGADEVTAQNKLFNILTCYGGGLRLSAPGGEASPEVRDWAFAQSLPEWFLEQCTDMKHYFFTVSVVILSRDGRRINRLVHKDACHCRLEPADRAGRIGHVFYADWRDGEPAPGAVEAVELLDLRDPLGDLRRRLGLLPAADGRKRRRKFALLRRVPTVGCHYYPAPYYTAIFRGGSYDEKRLISAGKRAKLRNAASVKYQVEVERGYWERIIMEEGITDPVEARRRIVREKEQIRDFVAGVENSGKAWITGYYLDPDGHEVRDIRVVNIEGAKEGGDWSDDLQVAANTICYGDNVHPNLVGATPGKSQMNNSGSDKRELFTMKQALEAPFHDVMLQPVELVCRFNGWAERPSVPMVQLTTLDEHRDAKTVAAEPPPA